MELYRFYETVVLGLMAAAISNASRCPMAYEEDNGCVFYTATSDGSNTCFIHITDKESDFAVRKSETLTEAILDFTHLSQHSAKPNTRGRNSGKTAKPNDGSVTTTAIPKLEQERKNIFEIIKANWTRVQAISSGVGEPTAYVIGTGKYSVPVNFNKTRTYIWVRGSLHYTNDTKCFPDKLNLTTSQSTDTQYMTTTQSTDTQYMTTTQSTHTQYMTTTQSIHTQYMTTTQSTSSQYTSDYNQSTPSTESATATGSSEQWWLYVIIGVLLMIVALLAVIAAYQKRRKTDDDDAVVLRHRDGNSKGPQIPDFYGDTDGGFQTASNPEEHIYEEPDLYAVTHTYENANGNGGPVTCGNESSGGHPMSPTTRRGSAHDSENSLYGCITGGDFQV